MSDTTPPLPPVTVSRRREVRIQAELFIALIAVCVAGALAWFNVAAKAAEIEPLKARVDQHAAALAKLDIVANDIAWIKDELKRRRAEGGKQ